MADLYDTWTAPDAPAAGGDLYDTLGGPSVSGQGVAPSVAAPADILEATPGFDLLEAVAPESSGIAMGLQLAHKGLAKGQRANRIIELSNELPGMPPEFIDENLDEAEDLAFEGKFDFGAYARSSPKMALWIANNPYHGAAMKHQLNEMNWIERGLSALVGPLAKQVRGEYEIPGAVRSLAVNSFGIELPSSVSVQNIPDEHPFAAQNRESGVIQLELADLSGRRFKYGDRGVTDEERARMSEIRDTMQAHQRFAVPGNFIVGETIKLAPQMLHGGWEALQDAALIGSIGFLKGGPLVGLAGFKAGMATGFARFSFETSRNLLYDELREAGIPDGDAKIYATAGGAASAVLETVGGHAMAKIMPGIRGIIGGAGKKAAQRMAAEYGEAVAKQIAARAPMRAGIKRAMGIADDVTADRIGQAATRELGKDAAESIFTRESSITKHVKGALFAPAVEGLTEGTDQMFQSAMKIAAEMDQADAFSDKEPWRYYEVADEFMGKLWATRGEWAEAALAGAAGAGGFAAVGGAATFAPDIINARGQARAANYLALNFKMVVDADRASGLKGEGPKIGRGLGDTTVFDVPLAYFEQMAIANNVTGEQLAQTLGESDRYARAVSDGSASMRMPIESAITLARDYDTEAGYLYQKVVTDPTVGSLDENVGTLRALHAELVESGEVDAARIIEREIKTVLGGGEMPARLKNLGLRDIGRQIDASQGKDPIENAVAAKVAEYRAVTLVDIFGGDLQQKEEAQRAHDTAAGEVEKLTKDRTKAQEQGHPTEFLDDAIKKAEEGAEGARLALSRATSRAKIEQALKEAEGAAVEIVAGRIQDEKEKVLARQVRRDDKELRAETGERMLGERRWRAANALASGRYTENGVTVEVPKLDRRDVMRRDGPHRMTYIEKFVAGDPKAHRAIEVKQRQAEAASERLANAEKQRKEFIEESRKQRKDALKEGVGLKKEIAKLEAKARTASKFAKASPKDKALANAARDAKKDLSGARVRDQRADRVVKQANARIEKLEGQAMKDLLAELKSKAEAAEAAFRKASDALPDDGMSVDDAATLFHYESAAEFITDLTTANNFNRELSDRVKVQQHLRGNVEISQAALAAAVQEAMHSQRFMEIQHEQLIYMTTVEYAKLKGLDKKLSKPLSMDKDTRAAAVEYIAAMPERDVDPAVFLKRQEDSRREALILRSEGEFGQALWDAKYNELRNAERYRAAKEATIKTRKSHDKINNKYRKGGGPKIRAKGWREAFDGLLERYGYPMKEGTSRASQGSESLVDFVQRVHDETGISMDLPESILADPVPMGELTMQQSLDAAEAVDKMLYVGRVMDDGIKGLRKMEMAEQGEQIVKSIQANATREPRVKSNAPGFLKRFRPWLDSITAPMHKTEFILERLDGDKANGATHRYIMRPINKASDTKAELMQLDIKSRQEILNKYYSKAEISAMWDTAKYHEVLGMDLNKVGLLMIAANWGNEGNREALLAGYQAEGWTKEKIEKVLREELTDRDGEFVQDMLNHLDSYRERAFELHRRMTGILPRAVEASEMVIGGKTFKGGYMPIVAAANRELDAQPYRRSDMQAEAGLVQQMFEVGGMSAMTSTGHFKARKGSTRPLELTFRSFSKHLNEVIHDLAFREAIIDVNAILTNDEVAAAIKSEVGDALAKQLPKWLKAVAADRIGEHMDGFESFIGKARSAATMMAMGYKASVALIQVTGYTVSAKDLGLKYAHTGLKQAFGDPIMFRARAREVFERSSFMRQRFKGSYDRDVLHTLDAALPGEKFGTWAKAGSKVAPIKRYAFTMIGVMDMAVSIPTWLGARQKALDGQVENIELGDLQAAEEYADRTVRATQGAGDVKDLASIQRGTQFQRLFTSFYQYGSTLYNQLSQTKRMFSRGQDPVQIMTAFALLTVVPATLEMVLRGEFGQEMDDEEWTTYLLKKYALYPLQSIPVIRGAARRIEYGRSGATPGVALLESFALGAVKAPGLAAALIEGDDDYTRTDVKDVFTAIAGFFGMPGNQAWLTAEGLFLWHSGDQEPQDAIDAAQQVIFKGRNLAKQ